MITEELQQAVLNVLKRWDNIQRGYWFGWHDLFDDLEVFHGLIPKHEEVNKAIKELRAQELIIIKPIFSKWTGKLSGSGYFYNYEKFTTNKSNI